MKGKEMRKLIAVVLLTLSAAVASAQPQIVYVSDLIAIHAKPTSVPADGVSSSTITITVYYPKELPVLGGQPAANTRVDVSADVGTLIDAKNESNRGKDITVYTADTGSATVYLTSTDVGNANVTAIAPEIGEILKDLRGNNNTIYRVRNSTTVHFFTPGETPAVSPSPTTNVTPTSSPSASPNVTVSPTVIPTITPSASSISTTTPPTPSFTSSPPVTQTPAPSPSATPSTAPPIGGIPGFSVMFAIVGLLVAAYMLLRASR